MSPPGRRRMASCSSARTSMTVTGLARLPRRTAANSRGTPRYGYGTPHIAGDNADPSQTWRVPPGYAKALQPRDLHEFGAVIAEHDPEKWIPVSRLRRGLMLR